jgi:hypothetical protein
MMARLAALALLGIAGLTSGCTSTSELDTKCSQGTAHPECPPGTPARIESDYRSDVSEIDRQRCQSFGRTGSEAYSACLSRLQGVRTGH